MLVFYPYDFSLNGAPVDLAVFSDRINDTLYIYRIDPNASTNPLTLVSADLLTHIFPGSVNGAAGRCFAGARRHTCVFEPPKPNELMPM